MLKRIALTTLAAAATFTTAALGPAAVTPAAAQGVSIYFGPPQPRYYAPPVQRVWAPGYWTWHHGRQVWVDGHWVTRTVAPGDRDRDGVPNAIDPYNDNRRFQ